MTCPSVPYVPRPSTTAPCVLHGDRDPHSRGHPTSEENSGNRGRAGERALGGKGQVGTAVTGLEREESGWQKQRRKMDFLGTGHHSWPSPYPHTDAEGHQEGQSAAPEEVRAATGCIHHQGTRGTQAGRRLPNCQPGSSLTPHLPTGSQPTQTGDAAQPSTLCSLLADPGQNSTSLATLEDAGTGSRGAQSALPSPLNVFMPPCG